MSTDRSPSKLLQPLRYIFGTDANASNSKPSDRDGTRRRVARPPIYSLTLMDLSLAGDSAPEPSHACSSQYVHDVHALRERMRLERARRQLERDAHHNKHQKTSVAGRTRKQTAWKSAGRGARSAQENVTKNVAVHKRGETAEKAAIDVTGQGSAAQKLSQDDHVPGAWPSGC